MVSDPAGGGSAEVAAFLREALADPNHGWSLGSFGALAKLHRAPGEPFQPIGDGRLGGIGASGAIALDPAPELRLVAYETAFGADWSQAIALCLPEDACAMGRRSVLTEIGPDLQAVRPEDRAAILFDLGLGLSAVDACLRTREPAALAALRAGLGRPAPDPLPPELGPEAVDRVFLARPVRIELFAPARPNGPRAFIVPRLLRARRTHAATAPIPPGLVPFAACHPAHPLKDREGRPTPARPERHVAFQAMLARWGDARLVAVKRAAEAGTEIEAHDRHARNAVHAARAQAVLR